MKVRDVMEPNAITIASGTPYQEVARILYTRGISGAPVLDAKGALIGMISEKDLFRILYPFYRSFYEQPEAYADLEDREGKIDEVRSKPVDVFMSKNVTTIGPDAAVMRAGALMLAKQIHHLPVLEEGKLVGIITRSRIYRTILRQHFGV